jgi:hypothetical protein
MSEGWAKPPRATKRHYFVDGRCFCGRWEYIGLFECDRRSDRTRADNCNVCDARVCEGLARIAWLERFKREHPEHGYAK